MREELAEFLWAFQRYAGRKGEAWRVGEGVELMDAYQALLASLDKEAIADLNCWGEIRPQ